MNETLDRFSRVDRLGDWRIGPVVGEGRSGMAFEATETVPPFRTGVIKINLGNGKKSSRKSFVREREFAASNTLKDGKPEFFAGGEWHGIPYFIMERVTKLPRNQPLAKVVKIADALIALLIRLRDLELIHRDIKLENVGLSPRGLVIYDYGTLLPLAQAALDRRVIGTGKYKAYEVCSGNPCTEQSEIHAVVTLIETICDDHALDVLEPVIRKGRASGLSERYPDYETLRDAIHKAKRRSQLPKRLAVTAGVVATFGILVAAMLKVFNADRQAERQSTFERIGLRAYAATNYVKAAHFLQRAADTGSTNGLVYYELAEIHARGRGIRQDRIQAISYAQRAFDLGYTNALPMLRRLRKLQGTTGR